MSCANFEVLSTDPKRDQSRDKVQLDKPLSFIVATYRNMDEGLFTGTEMTHQKSIPEWATIKKKLEIQNTLHIL